MITMMKPDNRVKDGYHLALVTKPASNERTETLLAAMLTEPVGHNPFDSGCLVGYRNEDNAAAGLTREKLNAEPTATMDFEPDGNGFTINLYHFLRERLQYAPNLDRIFRGVYARQMDAATGRQATWVTLAKGFPDWLKKHGYDDVDTSDVLNVNTYNSVDSSLSQVIQYVAFRMNRDTAVFVLQIHGGADVRSGYTDARVFIGERIYDLVDDGKGTVSCTGITAERNPALPFNGDIAADDDPYHCWDTEDGGSSWEPVSGETPLEAYPKLTREEFEAEQNALFAARQRYREEHGSDSPPGVRLYDTDGTLLTDYGDSWPVRGYLCSEGSAGFCPVCGSPLTVHMFPVG